jgi:hypothetical protein
MKNPSQTNTTEKTRKLIILSSFCGPAAHEAGRVGPCNHATQPKQSQEAFDGVPAAAWLHAWRRRNQSLDATPRPASADRPATDAECTKSGCFMRDSIGTVA